MAISERAQLSPAALRAANETREPPTTTRYRNDPASDDAVYWTLSDATQALKAWWPLILMVTIVSAGAMGLIGQFVLTRWYLATAVIRPTPATAVENRLTGLLSEFGAGAALGGVSTSSEAEEFIPILQSFDFTMGLVQRHHLVSELIPEGEEALNDLSAASRRQQWEVFDAIKRRFDYEFSLTTGNLVLFYQDIDPSRAERILGYFIDDLRDRLRRRQIQDASAAINSLEAEIKVTGDVLLQSQLYELTAKQVQREKLAEVEADFAFTVLQAPAAPDKPHRPNVLLDSVLAGIMAMLAAAGVAVAYQARRGVRDTKALGLAPGGGEEAGQRQ